MKSIIHKLDPKTIDQIAAGEVIEGPQSCIKELLDNALDARASEITVEISVGGREAIVVKDNGVGMGAEDLLMSIERHATSKIRTTSDLDRLVTLGFRGEALSSMASVSKMTLTSCPKDEALSHMGAQLVIEGGEVLSYTKNIQAVGGTVVEISNLFYNTPARRKFMKSPAKEAQEIHKTLQQIALAHPTVSFRYIVDNELKIRFSAPAEGQDPFFQRIRDVVGKEATLHGVFFAKDLKVGISLRGFLADPSSARGSRNGQILLVNNRPISSTSLSYAVKAGYASSIAKEQHPVYVLSLEIDPHDVDVNVHPQKKEVRFHDEEALKRLIESAVAEALFSSAPVMEDREVVSSMMRAEPIAREVYNPRPPSDIYRQQENFFPKGEQQELMEALLTPKVTEIKDTFTTVFCGADGIYALVSDQSNTYLIDILHTAKACFIFEEMERREKRSINPSEQLLVPHILRLSPLESAKMEQRLGEAEALGFCVRPFGQDSFMIEAIPRSMLRDRVRVDRFFQEWLSEDTIRGDMRGVFRAATLFMKALNGPEIPREYIQHIVKEWRRVGSPRNAPSGETLALELTSSTMSSFFKKSMGV